jgi:hypothetical protein
MDSKQFEKISKAISDPHRIKILQEFKSTAHFLHAARILEISDMRQPSNSHTNVRYSLNEGCRANMLPLLKVLNPKANQNRKQSGIALSGDLF